MNCILTSSTPHATLNGSALGRDRRGRQASGSSGCSDRKEENKLQQNTRECELALHKTAERHGRSQT